TILSCGITTTAGVTIGMDTPVAHIASAGALTFCEGGSVLLSGNAGMTNYLWYPDSITGQNISAKDSALYTLVTTDSLGCKATDTISVRTYPNNVVAPVVSDAAVCPDQSVILTANGSGNIIWFSGPATTDTLHTGNIYSLGLV